MTSVLQGGGGGRLGHADGGGRGGGSSSTSSCSACGSDRTDQEMRSCETCSKDCCRGCLDVCQDPDCQVRLALRLLSWSFS